MALKTKITVFGSQEEVVLEFNGSQIDQVNEYKYLGNVIRSTQKSNADPFALNYSYLCDQARKALFSAKQRLSNIGILPPETMFYLFNSLIRPILTYGSDVWGVNRAGQEKK